MSRTACSIALAFASAASCSSGMSLLRMAERAARPVQASPIENGIGLRIVLATGE